MSVQGVPVPNRPAAFERVNPRSTPGDANPKFYNLAQGGWLLSWITKRSQHGISNAADWRHSPNHSNFYGHKLSRMLVLWLLIGTLFVPLIGLSHGFELPQEEKTTYLRLALGNSNGVIRKFSKTGALAVIGACTSIRREKCNKTILNKRTSDSFSGINRLGVKITSQNPDIIFLFADTSGALNIRRQLSKSYVGGFIDSDDVDCQLYYSIRQNVIEKIHIVVSLDSPELKQKLCLAVQLPHGLGLALTSDLPFSKIWKQAPVEMLEGENVFTERNVSMIKEGYGVFSYIHMCPDIKPGMKADDLMRILSGNSICADGLNLLP